MKLKKGDKVKVLLGKDRGKEGKVEYVLVRKAKVFVGGVNLYKRHVRKMQGMEGGIIDIPKPMDVSNVGLICPNCQKVTRVSKLRVCKKCQKEIKYETKK